MTDIPSELTSVTVYLLPVSVLALDQAAAREKLSRTDIINRALQLYNFLRGEALDRNKVVRLLSPDGSVEELTFPPR